MSEERFILDDDDDSEKKIGSLYRAARGIDSDERPISSDVRGLCRNCSHAQVMVRGEVEHQETTIFCHNLNAQVRPGIVECSQFEQRGSLSLRDLASMALIIDPREGPPSWEKRI